MKKLCIIFLFFAIITNAQNIEQCKLANQYYNNGDFSKAMIMYQSLSKHSENIGIIHTNYFSLLLLNKKYNEANKYIQKTQKIFPNNWNYKLDEGILLLDKLETEKANKYFEQLFQQVAKIQYLVRIFAEYFIDKEKYDMAIAIYKFSQETLNNKFIYSLQLAQIYRMQNDKENMVKSYVKHVLQFPSNLSYIKNTLQNLLIDDEDFMILEKHLYQIIQLDSYQDNYQDNYQEILSELLLWLNIQKKEFYAAFIQARSLDKLQKNKNNKSLELGKITLENKDYETAMTIFEYVNRNYTNNMYKELANFYIIQSKEKISLETYPLKEEDINNIILLYDEFAKKTNNINHAVLAIRSKVYLLTYYKNNIELAIEEINKYLNKNTISQKDKLQLKLDLADIYLLNGEYWESSLIYSQLEKESKETELGYMAKLKNAKLLYYKGEFALAEEHLNILKQATTREISNDAIELSLFIKDNSTLDTINTALIEYADLELKILQNQYDFALLKIDSMLEKFTNHSLEDDLLWKKGLVYKKLNQFDSALYCYQHIVDKHKNDLLADDASYNIADLYENYLFDKQQAKEKYREFITNYPGSVFVSEARKRYRILRGDFKNTSTFE